MSFNIEGYCAEGPFLLGNDKSLQARSGVYVILGRRNVTDGWSVVDIGEAGNIRERVSGHDRAPCWHRQGHAELSVAMIYADERNRMLIEHQLRTLYNPPCGLV